MTSLPASDPGSAAVWGSKRINPRPQFCLCLAWSGCPSNDDDDDESHHLVNRFPYLGKDAQRPTNQSVSEYVVTKLAEPFFNKGQSITCDNFFTSVTLAKLLKSKKTSIVGTVNKIRREVPKAIKNIKLPLYSTRIFKNEELTLMVYQGKPSNNVLILSSVQRSDAISDTPKKLPESVTY